MRYFFAGLFTGIVINLLIFTSSGALEIYPVFGAALSEIELKTEPSPLVSVNEPSYPLRRDLHLDIVSPAGRLLSGVSLEGEVVSLSGDGRYYASFSRTGKEVEFRGASGERYWKLKSMEYAYVSHSGRIVLLLVGDQSAVRVVDINGNYIRTISGRLCTTVAFSDGSDYSCIGFMDGTYYFLDEKGNIVMSGQTQPGFIVKGVAVSNNGMFGCVHFGNTDRDGLRIINREKNKSTDLQVKGIHVMKTAMHIRDDGVVLFLDQKGIQCLSRRGGTRFFLDMPEKRPGQSSISFGNGLYAVAYTDSTGRSRAYFLNTDGEILYGREFAAETFLSSCIRGEYIFLRGSEHLYGYAFRQ